MSLRLMRANRPWLLAALDEAADDDDDGDPYAAGHPHEPAEEWVEEIAMSDGEVEELVADALLHAVVRYGGYGEARVSDMLRHCL